MKALRLPRALFASCLLFALLAALTRPLLADDEIFPMTFRWNGAVSNNPFADANWTAVDGFGHINPGLGSLTDPDNVLFGDADHFNLVIPAPGFAVNDITFDASTNDYDFAGISNPSLLIFGDVFDNSSEHTVTLKSTLGVALLGQSEGSLWHTVCVLSDATLRVESNIAEIGGSAGLEKNGSGTLVLSGNNTFTGGITVNRGTLALASSSHTDNEGGVDYGPVGLAALKLENGTTLAVADDSSLNLHNAIDLACFSGEGVTFDTGAGNLMLHGVIDGSAPLYKTGSGTLTLTGQNTFDGGLTIQQGTLAIGRDSRPDEDYSGSVLDGPIGTGTLKLEDSTTLSVANNGTFTFGNGIDLGCYEGEVNFDTGSGQLTLSGYIGGEATMVKKGTGTLVLMNEDSDFEGGVTVKAGTLKIGASSWVSSDEGGGESSFALSEGGETLGVVRSGPVGTGTLTMEAGTTLGLFDDGTYTLDNAIALGSVAGTVNLDTGWGRLTLTSPISGTAGLNKVGGGILDLESNNTFDGDFYVSNGVVNVNADHGLGNGALEFGTSNNGQVNFYTENPVIHGLEGNNTGTEVYLGGTATVLTIDQDENTAYKGAIAGNHGSVVKQGSGNLTLSGASTVTDGLEIASGTITLAGSSHTMNGTSVDTSPVGTGQLSILDGATLSVQGKGITLLNDVWLGGTSSAVETFFTPTGAELTIGNGTLGVISGAGSLRKTGLGTLTLMTANSYSGGTDIREGTLAVGNAQALGTGGVTLNGGSLKLTNGLTNLSNFSLGAGGGTLSGNWVFSTLQTFGTGVTLSPGNSPGTMTFNAGYAPTNGVTTVLEFRAGSGTAGTDWDVLNVTGDLTLTGISTGMYHLSVISLDGNNTQGAQVAGLTSPTSWTIFSASSITGFANGGTQFSIDQSQFYGGGIFSVSQVGSSLVLNFTPVPEPSTYALLAAGLGLGGLAAWRKRRRA